MNDIAATKPPIHRSLRSHVLCAILAGVLLGHVDSSTGESVRSLDDASFVTDRKTVNVADAHEHVLDATTEHVAAPAGR